MRHFAQIQDTCFHNDVMCKWFNQFLSIEKIYEVSTHVCICLGQHTSVTKITDPVVYLDINKYLTFDTGPRDSRYMILLCQM